MAHSIVNGNIVNFTKQFNASMGGGNSIYIGNTSYAGLMYNGTPIVKIYKGSEQLSFGNNSLVNLSIQVHSPTAITSTAQTSYTANYQIKFCDANLVGNTISTYVFVNLDELTSNTCPFNFSLKLTYTSSESLTVTSRSSSRYPITISTSGNTTTVRYTKNALKQLNDDYINRNNVDEDNVGRYTYTLLNNSEITAAFTNYPDKLVKLRTYIVDKQYGGYVSFLKIKIGASVNNYCNWNFDYMYFTISGTDEDDNAFMQEIKLPFTSFTTSHYIETVYSYDELSTPVETMYISGSDLVEFNITLMQNQSVYGVTVEGDSIPRYVKTISVIISDGRACGHDNIHWNGSKNISTFFHFTSNEYRLRNDMISEDYIDLCNLNHGIFSHDVYSSLIITVDNTFSLSRG